VELGASDLALPTAGNAGAALAAYAARAGKTATVAMPVDTPKAIQAECRAHSARVLLVDGLINDAAKVIRAGAEGFGWFDVSTLKEPYRAEGKKTMGFEVVEQLGWRVPDAIVFPTGGGTGIVGMWKAFAEFEAAGLIDGKRPKMFVIQAEGCAPIVRAFEEGASVATPWQNAATWAPGIRVPVAIGDYLILQAIRESGGAAIAVTDDELMEAVALTASLEGIFMSPESGAAVAGVRILRQRGLLEMDELTVVFATGSGLMHTELIGEIEYAIDPNTPNLLEAIKIALRQEGLSPRTSQVIPAVGSGMRMDSP
jgi:threonine synthase